MRREENWAIAPERVRLFFRKQPDVTETDGGFQFAQCKISLLPCQGQLMGKWQQQRTIVILEGPDADTNRIYQRFFLHFLSAGG
jgi:hypothetical protein